MKNLVLTLTACALVSCLQAQEATTTSSTPTSASVNNTISAGSPSNSQTLKQQANQPQKQAPSAPANVKEKGVVPTGLIYDISEKGLIVISPSAPPSMGYYPMPVPKNPFPRNLSTSAVTEQDRTGDGIHLFGWAW